MAVTVNFVGNLDKKTLIFPIAQAYANIGTCLIVTDDESYTWYTNDQDKIGDVKVLIKRPESITFTEDKDYDDGTDYQYVIYDTKKVVSFDKNRVVVVRNKDRTVIPTYITDITDEADINGAVTPSKEVVLTAQHSKMEERKKQYLKRGNELKEKALLVEITGNHYKWLQECSENKEILALKDSKLVQLIVSIVDGLDKTPAKTLEKATQENTVEVDRGGN